MKISEHHNAINLRKEGLSVREIAKKLNVSKGTVSIWTRDIELTEEQKNKLLDQGDIRNRQWKGAKARKDQSRKLRESFQLIGKKRIIDKDLNFKELCLLYWTEGTKDKNSLKFCNTDVYLVKYFLKLFRSCFNINENKLSIYLTHHIDNGLSLEEIQKYWLDNLNLKKEHLRKTTIRHARDYSGFKQNKYPYGICSICYGSTEIIQSIFGGIQEIGSFLNPGWLQ